jgi:hypothetical protein
VSSPVLFSALLLQFQQRANLENRAGFITVPEQRSLLNEGLQEFHELLIKAPSNGGKKHLQRRYDFQSIQGTSDYPLPRDFLEMFSLDIELSTNQFLTCTPYMEFERNAFRLYPAFSGWYFGAPVYYAIYGSSMIANTGTVPEKIVRFQPIPQSNYPCHANYIYTFPEFALDGSNDGNAIDSINGWTMYAVWWAVSAARHKMKEDPTFAMARMAAIAQRISELSGETDAGAAERIKDVCVDYDSITWWQ